MLGLPVLDTWVSSEACLYPNRLGMRISHLLAVGLVMLATAAHARGEPDGSEPPAGGLPPALIATLTALGAASGVPDGLGIVWEPARPVAGQPATLSLINTNAGLTIPVWTSPDEGVFATGSVRGLFANGGAFLPTDRVAFPAALWDIQAGGAYVRQVGEGQSCGVFLAGGTASDRPFHSVHEATISGFAFWRSQPSADHAWLLYVASVTNGQLGQNIPIPGIAYEIHIEELNAIIGFPFLSAVYRPEDQYEFEVNYAAFTDVRSLGRMRVADGLQLFGGFSWVSQSWFRAERSDHRAQLFWYEKRLEGGAVLTEWAHAHIDLSGGYAFDRYFLEARDFTLNGRNHTGLAPGPFLHLQIELQF